MVEKTNKVELKLMRKILRIEKKTFSREISSWSDDFGYTIEGNYLVIPLEKVSKFTELLMQDKPFQKESL